MSQTAVEKCRRSSSLSDPRRLTLQSRAARLRHAGSYAGGCWKTLLSFRIATRLRVKVVHGRLGHAGLYCLGHRLGLLTVQGPKGSAFLLCMVNAQADNIDKVSVWMRSQAAESRNVGQSLLVVFLIIARHTPLLVRISEATRILLCRKAEYLTNRGELLIWRSVWKKSLESCAGLQQYSG